MKNWLYNQNIIVTGASGGIGKELCRLLITRYNANVIGVARSEEKLRAFKDELGEFSHKFSYYVFDVSNKEAWFAFANTLQSQNTPIRLLINNAGIFPSFQTVENTPDEIIEMVMQTNFYSATYATQAFSTLLFADKTGAIVNISSSAALCTIVGTAAYSASKSALKAYTEALALDKKDNYVGIIYPGTTKTELFRNDVQTENSALDKIAMSAPKMAKKILRKIRKRKKRAVVGWDAKLMNFATKIAPVKGLFLIRYVMKKSKSKVFKNVFNQ